MEYTYHTTSLRQELSQPTEYVLIPIVELVRRWLLEQDALHPGQVIQTSIRKISDAIGAGRRAWGSITPALKRLEDDEFIERLSSRCGTLIQVRHPQGDRPSDHLDKQAERDRPLDHLLPPEHDAAEPSSASPSVLPTDRGDRPSDHLECPEAGDRPSDHLACIRGTRMHARVRDHDQQQQQQDHAARSFLHMRPHAVYPQAWQKILQTRIGYTVQDWERDLATISTRRDLKPEQWVGTLVLILQSPDEQVLGQTEIDAATAELTARYSAPAADVPASPAPPSKQEPPAPQRRNRSRSGPPAERLYQPIVVEDIAALQAEREQRAQKLCPGATYDELVELCIAFDAGLDDAAALAALQTAREAGYV